MKIKMENLKNQVQKKLKDFDTLLLKKFPQLKKIQEKNVSPSAMIAAVVLILLLLFVLVLGVGPISNLVGFVYPAIESFKCMTSNGTKVEKDMKQWLAYWLIYGVLINLEGLCLSEFIYFYDVVKIGVLVGCMLPQFRGAEKLFEMAEPIISKHFGSKTKDTNTDTNKDLVNQMKEKVASTTEQVEEKIDEVLAEAGKKAD